MRNLRARGGQFIPISGMLIFTAVMLAVATANIYKVSKAKLEAQNMADAVALAVAAMEAKAINAIVDRNEWLNHLYPANVKNKDQLPRLSEANGWKAGKNKAAQYAQLVLTINKAQSMFNSAYNKFIGADRSTLGSTDVGALADILAEIKGLQDPNVRVAVYNTTQGQEEAKSFVKKLLKSGGADVNSMRKIDPFMKELKFKTEPITVDLGKGGKKTLRQVLELPPGPNGENEIGWVRPAWEDAEMGLEVKTKTGTEKQIGAGALVVKCLSLPAFGDTCVQANSVAYVVRKSGVVDNANNPGRPPAQFRPTYFVQLGRQ